MISQLEKLKQQEKQLKERIRKVEARQRGQERKNDTRRKILIGGAVLAKLRKGEWSQEKIDGLIRSEITNERDLSLFDIEHDAETKIHEQ